jgi:hypothetical protein
VPLPLLVVPLLLKSPRPMAAAMLSRKRSINPTNHSSSPVLQTLQCPVPLPLLVVPLLLKSSLPTTLMRPARVLPSDQRLRLLFVLLVKGISTKKNRLRKRIAGNKKEKEQLSPARRTNQVNQFQSEHGLQMRRVPDVIIK